MDESVKKEIEEQERKTKEQKEQRIADLNTLEMNNYRKKSLKQTDVDAIKNIEGVKELLKKILMEL